MFYCVFYDRGRHAQIQSIKPYFSPGVLLVKNRPGNEAIVNCAASLVNYAVERSTA